MQNPFGSPDDPRSAADEPAPAAAELAAARALAAYREAAGRGQALNVEQLVESWPGAEDEIRRAIEAYSVISQALTRPSPAVAAAPPAELPRIPGYRLQRILGEGGMGVVYAATQESLQRPVAIKVLAEHLERNAEVIARFNREIKLLTRMTHPNIVDIIDAGVAGDRHYYVMEYVDGLSLARILRKHRVRSHTAVLILKQIVQGLAAAHRQGILHRDLKPGNILLDRDAVVRIADFGLAGILPSAMKGGDAITRIDARLGTVGYMSPEQLGDARVCDERSDIYSVGVIFYQMLTGSLPHGRYSPASELVPGTTSAIDRLIDRCLQTDPAERFQSCESLLRTVGKLERRIERTRKKLLERARRIDIGSFDDDGLSADYPSEADPDLRLVIETWGRLPDPLRAGIVAIVRAARQNGLPPAGPA